MFFLFVSLKKTKIWNRRKRFEKQVGNVHPRWSLASVAHNNRKHFRNGRNPEGGGGGRALRVFNEIPNPYQGHLKVLTRRTDQKIDFIGYVVFIVAKISRNWCLSNWYFTPFMGSVRLMKDLFASVLLDIALWNIGFWQLSGLTEDLGRSGDMVVFIYTYPHISPTPWCRFMAKNSGGIVFFVYGVWLTVRTSC